MMEWEDIEAQGENTLAVMNRCSIKNLLEDDKSLKAAQDNWKKVNSNHQLLDLLYTKQELDKEVEWFQEQMTELLNKHAKITQITSYSKLW